jgi:hypothetical protein
LSRVAKRTLGLNRLILSAGVRNLTNAGKGKENTAEVAQSNPQWPRAFIQPRPPRKSNNQYAAEREESSTTFTMP